MKSVSEYFIVWRNPKASVPQILSEAVDLYRRKTGEEPSLIMARSAWAEILATMDLPWKTCECRYVHAHELYVGRDTPTNTEWCE